MTAWLTAWLMELPSLLPELYQPDAAPLNWLEEAAPEGQHTGIPSILSLAHCDDDDKPEPAAKRSAKPWTEEEDRAIIRLIARIGTQFPVIAAQMHNKRTADAVRNRWHKLQAAGLAEKSSGSEKPEPLLLRQKERRGWTAAEDAIIEEGVRKHGLKWRCIAGMLTGRSDSAIRNRYLRQHKTEMPQQIVSTANATAGSPPLGTPDAGPGAPGVEEPVSWFVICD